MGERPDKHFTTRWKERGLRKFDPWVLQDIIVSEHRKIRNGETSDVLFYVTNGTPDGEVEKNFYRFVIEGNPFYVIMAEATSLIVTLYDQDMFRRMRKGRKMKRKWRSMKGAVGKKARGE